MFKRLAAILLALSMLFVFAACGGNAGNGEGGNVAESEGGQPAEGGATAWPTGYPFDGAVTAYTGAIESVTANKINQGKVTDGNFIEVVLKDPDYATLYQWTKAYDDAGWEGMYFASFDTSMKETVEVGQSASYSFEKDGVHIAVEYSNPDTSSDATLKITGKITIWDYDDMDLLG